MYVNDVIVPRRPETLLMSNNQMITTENVIQLHKQNSQTKVTSSFELSYLQMQSIIDIYKKHTGSQRNAGAPKPK